MLDLDWIKEGVNSGLKKVNEYLEKNAIKVENSMLESVSSISCNNDTDLGKIIAEAYETVGKDGVVLMETSETEETYVEVVDGVQMDVGSGFHTCFHVFSSGFCLYGGRCTPLFSVVCFVQCFVHLVSLYVSGVELLCS